MGYFDDSVHFLVYTAYRIVAKYTVRFYTVRFYTVESALKYNIYNNDT